MKKNGKEICGQNDTVNCKRSIIIAKGEFVEGIVCRHLQRPDATHKKTHRRKYKSAFPKISRLVRVTALTDWRRVVLVKLME